MSAEETGEEIVVYRSADGSSQVQLRAVAGTVWMSQAEIADLYDTSVSNIAHIMRRILDDGEVTEATIDSQSIVRAEGVRRVRRDVKVYNLDMVLAVGYRVSSPRAVQFRQWATTTLREYLIKGFALDDRRLRQPGLDYFDELLERIRDIRASEQRFYQKVRELFAISSADYDRESGTARAFFATIQNKLIYAITQHTAAELVTMRCDADAPNLGLTSFSGGRVGKADVTVAKNYLSEQEVSDLNLLTTRFLDFAEDRARRRQSILMSEWVSQTDRFIDFDERPLLRDAGSVSAAEAKAVADDRYARFDSRRRADEARRAELEEAEDLRALAEIEKRRDGPDRG
ncbi:2-hydroxyacid dehydrogenase (plasmid) [Pseudonocardia sp. EC080610-09]|uniref:RhuM family protein n=1 Tax=unclassified Pseudonocardia TaxID=2619320 RepID=UPI000706AC29|nr:MULTISPECIES: RhuM family protein [unclassified Pseudonocardia]ALL79533.1 2-hydroxyacid dehydrogenase [Pseudonocardia sp. EC080610-09]ALL85515.1 2-hydroxyacid dehydrogenase [Pseudonocardia sp. EC080619-01]